MRLYTYYQHLLRQTTHCRQDRQGASYPGHTSAGSSSSRSAGRNIIWAFTFCERSALWLLMGTGLQACTVQLSRTQTHATSNCAQQRENVVELSQHLSARQYYLLA